MVDVDVRVVCSSGTYIRALARDLGAGLGVGGHLTALRRTRVGPYDLSVAHTLDALGDDFVLLPIADAARAAFPSRDVDAAEAVSVSHGVALPSVGTGGRPDRRVRPRRHVPRAGRGARTDHEVGRGLRLSVHSMRFSIVSSLTTSKPAFR